MTMVLDASAAIELALEKPDADYFRNILSKSDLVIVPDTFPSEITNVFWKYHSFSNLSIEICQSGIRYCLGLIDDFINTKALCSEVFSESIGVKHSTYDLFYLITARRNNGTLLTKDAQLISIAKSLKIKGATRGSFR
jgi:predicted nucleic acid-binding protein